jgi:hypothetical protein
MSGEIASRLSPHLLRCGSNDQVRFTGHYFFFDLHSCWIFPGAKRATRSEETLVLRCNATSSAPNMDETLYRRRPMASCTGACSPSNVSAKGQLILSSLEKKNPLPPPPPHHHHPLFEDRLDQSLFSRDPSSLGNPYGHGSGWRNRAKARHASPLSARPIFLDGNKKSTMQEFGYSKAGSRPRVAKKKKKSP